MKALIDWIDQRTGLTPALRNRLDAPAGGKVCVCKVWPATIFFAFCVQAITGFFLWMYYSPSAQTAWESVYFLQHEVVGGWLLRAVHHYSAQVLLVLIGLYLLQTIVLGAYRAPRELVFWSVVAMGLVCLGSMLTGDLLDWDQNSYASTKVRVGFLMMLPVVGEGLYKLTVGGPAFGHLTLTRFLSLHIGLFAGGLLGLLVLHALLARRSGPPKATCCSARHDLGEDAATKKTVDRRFNQAVLNMAACLVVLVVVLLLAVSNGVSGDEAGVELGAPADPNPANAYAAARPEWAFRGLYEFANSKIFPGNVKIIPIFIIPGLLVCVVLAMPWIARYRLGHVLNVAVTAVVLTVIIVLSFQSYAHDRESDDYQKALTAGRREAGRVLELARAEGIPAGGGLSLLLADPKTQGPKLYEQSCASCHNFDAPDATDAMVSDNPSAPDLYRFGSAEWIGGLLDPDQVGTAGYYGNTRFATGVMVRYVEDHFTKLPEEDRKAIVAALAAEARLEADGDDDPPAAEVIEKGKQLIAGRECARCHRYHDAGTVGVGPDLTGYGSREWLIGILADAAHPWFYGPRNDRMPTYFGSIDDPADNLLTAEQVELMARWLRGQWYEPPAPGEMAEREDVEQKPSKDRPVILTLDKWQSRRMEGVLPSETGPHAEARTLYRREHCALCHGYTGGVGEDIESADPVAPDLGNYASRAWIAGLLDPKQIKTAKYFGNSRFRSGEMVDFIVNELPDLLEESETEAIVAALSAEAALPSQKDADEAAADQIEEGRQLIGDYCGDCHRFGDAKGAGAPELNGYGSRPWIIALISDPKSTRFYPKTNDAMPSYLSFPEHPGRNLLTESQIGALADWLRGEKGE
ncbi:MAG TPA: c-type cytochrome [Thermoguttaceae bacterium]|nr:c-type cytochrome [Thermoguttaceae bacterium]